MRSCQLVAVGAFFVAMVWGSPSVAQTTERVWDQGSVWTVTYVRTNPGAFNAYLKDLSLVWRSFLEEQKATGDVLSYKILSVQDTRDQEPNLILMVELKNMAVFDRGVGYFEEMTKKIMGSLEDMQTANMERGELRDLRGSLLARELYFME